MTRNVHCERNILTWGEAGAAAHLDVFVRGQDVHAGRARSSERHVDVDVGLGLSPAVVRHGQRHGGSARSAAPGPRPPVTMVTRQHTPPSGRTGNTTRAFSQNFIQTG